MEAHVYELVHAASKVLAVRYSGDSAQANLLAKHGWLEGADMGFGRKNADTVLRGLVQSKVVYPGDVIVLHPNWELEVFENAVFQERYEEPDEVIVLTDGQDDPPIDWEKFIPRGDAVDSILLEELPSALPDPIQGVGMKTSYQDEMAPMPDDPQPGPQAVDDPPDDNDEDDDDLEDEEDDE